MQLLLSNTSDLFLRIFEVFNEMEIEINVINNKIFTKLYLKIRVYKRKRNFIIYHFLVKSKPHERIDLLITASGNIYLTIKSITIVMKTCFSYRKQIKPFGTPSSLSTNPLFLSNFFMTPLLVQISKTTPPPPPPNFKGGGNYVNQ